MLMVYYKDKLVRFTGVPLNAKVECGDLTKTNSGLKQTNVPQGGRVPAEKGDSAPFFFCLKKEAREELLVVNDE
jgi:hypothetical protein